MIKVESDVKGNGCVRETRVDVNGRKFLVRSEVVPSSEYMYKVGLYMMKNGIPLYTDPVEIKRFSTEDDMFLFHDGQVEFLEDVLDDVKSKSMGRDFLNEIKMVKFNIYDIGVIDKALKSVISDGDHDGMVKSLNVNVSDVQKMYDMMEECGRKVELQRCDVDLLLKCVDYFYRLYSDGIEISRSYRLRNVLENILKNIS